MRQALLQSWNGCERQNLALTAIRTHSGPTLESTARFIAILLRTIVNTDKLPRKTIDNGGKPMKSWVSVCVLFTLLAGISYGQTVGARDRKSTRLNSSH